MIFARQSECDWQLTLKVELSKHPRAVLSFLLSFQPPTLCYLLGSMVPAFFLGSLFFNTVAVTPDAPSFISACGLRHPSFLFLFSELF